VDDMIITDDYKEIYKTIKTIKDKFKISKYEYANYLLGIKVNKDSTKDYKITYTGTREFITFTYSDLRRRFKR